MWKPVKFYKTCSPSMHLSDRAIDVDKITVSYGGGMGGVNETYYVRKIEVNSEGFYNLFLYDGETIEINKRFIVKIKPCKLVEIVSDITEHPNLNPDKHTKLIETVYYEIKKNQTYKFINKFGTNRARFERIEEAY